MATAETRMRDLATAIGTDIKTLTGRIGTMASLTTTEKTNLVGALNELKAAVDAAGSAPEVNDVVTNGTNTWSSQKISDQITAAINALANGAPTALNTIDELAAALGDDSNFAATITTALGNRVRTDTAAQGLSAQQKANARTNIDAYGSVELGNPDTDLVAVYNTAKA